MTKTVKRRKLSKRIIRIFYMFLVSIFFVYGSLFLYDSFYHGEKPEEVVLNYNVNNSASYNVKLKENAFIEKPELGENSTYISELVENILIKFDYEYVMSKNGRVTYQYSIIGDLVGEYQSSNENQNSEVWNKEIIYENNTEVTENNVSAIRLSKEVNVDFPYINQRVIDFKNELKLPIVAYLNVTLKVNVISHVDGEKIIENVNEVITIPCNQLAFSIKKNVPDNKQGKLTYMLPFDDFYERKFAISMILYLLALIIFFSNFKVLFNIKHRTQYTIRLEKLLRTYGDIIINLTTPLEEANLNIVQVTSFNEMIDLEEELRIPINFYEIDPGYEAEFSIIHNNIIYKYIFNEDSK